MQEAASVERQFLDLLARDHLVDGVPLHFNLLRHTIHRDRILLLAHLEVKFHRGDRPGRDHRVHREAAEARRFDAHFVRSGSQRRHAVSPRRIAAQHTVESRSGILTVTLLGTKPPEVPPVTVPAISPVGAWAIVRAQGKSHNIVRHR